MTDQTTDKTDETPAADPAAKPAYQVRVIEERDALEQKLAKLDDFVASDAFRDLLEDARVDLMDQRTAMTTYSAVLSRRIAKF